MVLWISETPLAGVGEGGEQGEGGIKKNNLKLQLHVPIVLRSLEST